MGVFFLNNSRWDCRVKKAVFIRPPYVNEGQSEDLLRLQLHVCQFLLRA